MICFHHAWAKLICKFKVYFVLIKHLERIDEKLGVERYGHLFPGVIDCHRFAALPHLRRVGSYGQVILRECHLHGVGLVTGHDLCPAECVLELLLVHGNAFF